MVNSMTSTPHLVSVVIPTYNNAKYIAECIDSVLNQTYKNIEIIIVDDGSTDNTEEVVAPFLNAYKNIIYKKIENSKSPTARNVGIAMANGEYISAIDSDDIWPDYKLELQVAALINSPNSVVLGSIQSFTVDENGVKQWNNVLTPPPVDVGCRYVKNLMAMSLEQMVIFNTFMAPAALIKEHGLWDPAFVTAHDWENWIRLAKQFQFIHIDKVFQYYRKHTTSTTRKRTKQEALHYQLAVINKHTKNYPDCKLSSKLNFKRIRYDNWIRIHLYERDFGGAFKLILKAAADTNMLTSCRGLKCFLGLVLDLIRRR